MFTPPPSPAPRPSTVQSCFELDNSVPQQHKEKSGRRHRLFAFLIPLALILITACTHPGIALSKAVVNQSFSWSATSLQERVVSTVLKRSVISNLSSNEDEGDDRSTGGLPPIRFVTSTPTTSIPPVPASSTSALEILPNPFPQPFDLSLSYNFSSVSCQNFFVNFTQSSDFRRCRPLSFILGYSNQFVEAERNITLLNDIVWGTCNTDASSAECQTEMNSLAQKLHSSCSTELDQNNILVEQALTGFQMFAPMREAGCLIDDTINSYCLTEAVADVSPADLYYYQLPYGNTLPNGTVPSCSSCIKSVLAIYAQAVTSPSANKDDTTANSPLDQTYGPAANVAVAHCGTPYAQQVNVSSSQPVIARVSLVLLWIFIFMAIGD